MKYVKNIYNFFPIRLLLLHFKSNHLFLLFWVFLFGFTSRTIAGKYGINYLFLTPEYLGEINFFSYALIGFSLGGFIMAFNIYSYILYAPKFLFITALSRPFYKFCINNAIVPLSFIIYYSFKSIQTQQVHEFISPAQSILNLLGFLAGLILFLLFSFLFFFKANKLKNEIIPEKGSVKTTLQKNNSKWYVKLLLGSKDTVEWYMTSMTSISRTRDTQHYSKAQLKHILSKNHINATVFEIALMISFVLLSLFGEYEVIFIPAAASIILAFTFILMLISALYSWINGWTIPLIIVFVISFNYITENTSIIDYSSKVGGLMYLEDQKQNQKKIEKISSIDVLNNWKSNTKEEKPKLVLVAVSGGGLRASTWVVNVLSTLKDSTKAMDNLHLITGSSGGMVGASYFREMYFLNENNYSKDSLIHHTSKDALNSLAFYYTVNDWLFRYKKYNYQNQQYTKERGYVFETQIEKNLPGLDKTFGFYKTKELNAEIPSMIFSPSIVSTNQQLIIASSDHKFTQKNLFFNANHLRNFDSVKLSSILRMNATFPYIMPIITTPAPERLNIMDAGLIDNFGIKVMSEFLNENQDWINENTSGVVLIKIVDKVYKHSETKYSPISKLSIPITFFYANFDLQNKDNNRLLEKATENIINYNEVEFNLGQSEDGISLSWHLTQKEKQNIIEAINSKYNKKSLELLNGYLNN